MSLKTAFVKMTALGTIGVAYAATGCGGERALEEGVAEREDALYLTGAKFPGRTIPVCYTDASLAREDFAQHHSKIQTGLQRMSWIYATGLHFSGFGACAGNGAGSIRINLVDPPHTLCSGGAASCSGVGYRSSSPTSLTLGTNFGVATIMHEMGHALGFPHEMRRPDFTDATRGGCRESDIATGDTLFTPPDRGSIMAGTGYCNSNPRLSYWDRVGAYHAYGLPNFFADLHADGKADAIALGPVCVLALPSSNDKFNPPPQPPVGTVSACWTTDIWYGHKGTFFADVTGDKKADLVTIDDNRVHVAVSTGAALTPPTWWTSSAFYGAVETALADVTGDGKADLIAIEASDILVRRSNGAKFVTTVMNFGPAPDAKYALMFGDVNADTKADLVFSNEAGVWVGLSNGASFDTPTLWTEALWVGDYGTYLADVDADDQADLIIVHGAGVDVRKSNGASFGVPQAFSTTPWYGERGTFFADTNGDRRADLIAVEDGSLLVRHSTGQRFGNTLTYLNHGFYGSRPDFTL